MIRLISCLMLAALFAGCTKSEKTITINASDFKLESNCIQFFNGNGKSVIAFRELEILENTLSDTVVIGWGVLPQGYKGRHNYLLPGEYTEDQEDVNNLPKIPEICISRFHKRAPSYGKVIIRFRY